MDDRLTRLEHRVRVQQRLLVAGGALALAAVTAAAAPSQAQRGSPSGDVVRCARVELVDAAGEVVATLSGGGSEGPALELRSGSRRLRLAVDGDGTGLSFGGPDGVGYLGALADGPYLNLRGKNLRNGVWTGVSGSGEAGFRAYGETLAVGARLEVDADGQPVLRLADDAGEPLTHLP